MQRQVTRGTNVIFAETFFETDGSVIVPTDPSRYPQISILDPEGTIVQEGLGVQISEGRYQYTWFVPVDAVLNNAAQTWSVVWYMDAHGGRVVNKELQFDVTDVTDITDTERAFSYLTMLGTSERLFLRFRVPQEEIVCTVTAPDGSQILTPATSMNRVDDRGEFVYYFDTPALTKTGDYIVVWQSRQTRISSAVTSVQMLRVPENCFYYLAPALRMLIDKAQKRTGLVQAYSDPDIYEYLKKGVDILNGYNPISSWTISTIPFTAGFETFLTYAAGIYALQAQILGETDINKFSFSGQTATLDVDRTPGYESILQRMQDQLDKNVEKAKIGLMRQRSMSYNANRPYDLSINSLIIPLQFRVGHALNGLPLLTTIGLI